MPRSLIRSLITLCGAISTLPLLPAAAAELPQLPPRVVASTDKAEFRRFTLPNGLKVLLVSDVNFNKSAAALAVGIGQIDDPFEHAGLAHFLEHMLFLGTEKYPDVKDYATYINTNGGYNNAYTSTDLTNYQFEIRHEALEGALDRFSQFFIAPLFNPDFTEREVNAVNNEAMRHVQNDLRRMLNVRRELYNPAAGESKFSTGNLQTLAHANADVVRAFYEATYSADRMALSIASNTPLDQLEAYARQYFSPVPNRDLPTIDREPIFLPRQAALRLATIEPVKEIRQLWLEFVIPPTRPNFASKPDALLLSLINYPGEGGLVKALKDADLATTVGGFSWTRTTGYESLFLSADLTPHGAASVQAVMELFFSYLKHLRDSPFPSAFYADQARIASLEESYRDRGEGAPLATELANNALYYPLSIAERAPIVWGQPDEAAYRELLNALTPDNMLATFQAKGVPTDRTEEIYESAYAYTETTGDAYDRLVMPPAVVEFALPSANPFIPGETKLVSERPLKLIDEEGLQLYYAQDLEFERPQTAVKFRFVPRRATATAETDLLLRFYETILQDAIEPGAGDAGIAGVDHTLSIGLEGLTLTVSGFADSPVRFVYYVLSRMRALEVTPARFASLSEFVVRNLNSYQQTEAYVLARDRSTAAMREFNFLPDHSLDRASSVTWAEVQTNASEFFAQGQLQILIHGHIIPEDATVIAHRLRSLFKAKSAPTDSLVRRANLSLRSGESIVDTAVIEGVNSAFWNLYIIPNDDPETRAAMEVIGNFMRTPYSEELRTKQQLGYIVGAGSGVSRGMSLLYAVIQSSAYAPDELQQRSDKFLATMPDLLANLPADKWATLVAGARSQLEEKPKSIAEKADHMFSLGYDYHADWDRTRDTLTALDQLTQADAAKRFAAALDPAHGRNIKTLVASKAHSASDAPPTFRDLQTWKETQTYQ